MESNMVTTFSNSNIQLVKRYLKDNLPNYSIVSESAHGPNWAIKFTKDNIEIEVSGDISFLIKIIIDKTKYDLWQYDRSVNNAMKTNDENITYQLNVLKRFLSEI